MPITPEWIREQRPRLFNLAYRLLSRASEAEEVVQEAWLKIHARGLDGVREPDAFATTVVTRLCLDRLRRAQVQREHYVGPWLPEPVRSSEASGDAALPDGVVERAQAVSIALLRVLDQLTPVQRAVFVLKEAFDHSHDDIAAMLGISKDNARQQLRRAKQRLGGDEAPVRAIDEQTYNAQARLVEAFVQASRSGQLEPLVAMLHPEVEWASDGGGIRSAATRPLVGRPTVMRLLEGLQRMRVPETTFTVEELNGLPAVVVRTGESIDSAITIELKDGLVYRIAAVRNPDKLAHLARRG